jgi:hypothetical protein
MSEPLQTLAPTPRPAAETLRFRDAHADELQRTAQLFPHVMLRRGAPRVFLALRSQPTERIVGSVCWRQTPGSDGRTVAHFRWGTLAALQGDGGEQALLEAFIDRLEAEAAVCDLRTADPLPDGAAAVVLRACGFQPAETLDIYEGDYLSCVARIRRFLAHAPKVGPDIVLATPTAQHSDALAELAAHRHPLMRVERLRAALTPGAQGDFDPAISAVLLQGETLLGACLVQRTNPGRITLPVLVVDAAASLPGGLVCALMFEHCQRLLEGEALQQVEFMTNPVLSPGLPRMARRFDCRPLRTLSIWRRALRAACKERGEAACMQQGCFH